MPLQPDTFFGVFEVGVGRVVFETHSRLALCGLQYCTQRPTRRRLGVASPQVGPLLRPRRRPGSTFRRKLLHECDVHTLPRLPTGLFYAQGVKANVIFFDKKPAAETPWTRKLRIYEMRTNKHFKLKTNPLKREDLDEFVALYSPKNRHKSTA
mgnify:CR=1 FL=1